MNPSIVFIRDLLSFLAVAIPVLLVLRKLVKAAREAQAKQEAAVAKLNMSVHAKPGHRRDAVASTSPPLATNAPARVRTAASSRLAAAPPSILAALVNQPEPQRATRAQAAERPQALGRRTKKTTTQRTRRPRANLKAVRNGIIWSTILAPAPGLG
ncbi:MAG: hypothetical protein EXS14_05995 [Planctomycetes bacterium]|nr:hypothetical protein [Planctomycetota bacterium]